MLYTTWVVATDEVELKPGDGHVIKVIAVIGDLGTDWAAYRGWANLNDWQIANFGTKLTQDVAEGLFPWFVEKGLKYRK